jgi:hypothetical protein
LRTQLDVIVEDRPGASRGCEIRSILGHYPRGPRTPATPRQRSA